MGTLSVSADTIKYQSVWTIVTNNVGVPFSDGILEVVVGNGYTKAIQRATNYLGTMMHVRVLMSNSDTWSAWKSVSLT